VQQLLHGPSCIRRPEIWQGWSLHTAASLDMLGLRRIPMRHPWLLALALTGCWVDDDAVFEAQDRDGDGFLPISVGGDDCYNSDPSVHPDAVEICGDGIDNDCDLAVDDHGEGALTFFRDADEDGWGDASDTIEACTVPTGYAAQAGDCAPDDPNRSPGARDLCNGIDDDCDGQIDEDATVSSWYYDADDAGWGDNASVVGSCEGPGDGWYTQAADC